MSEDWLCCECGCTPDSENNLVGSGLESKRLMTGSTECWGRRCGGAKGRGRRDNVRRREDAYAGVNNQLIDKAESPSNLFADLC